MNTTIVRTRVLREHEANGQGLRRMSWLAAGLVGAAMLAAPVAAQDQMTGMGSDPEHRLP